jgi:hypothetical protein
MILRELETKLQELRKQGACDNTPVCINKKRYVYLRNIKKVEFQEHESWPKNEWPIVIEEEGK